jgi:hypothetical protein
MTQELFKEVIENLEPLDLHSWNWQYNPRMRKYYVRDYYEEVASGDLIIELHSVHIIQNDNGYIEEVEYEVDDFITDLNSEKHYFTKEQFKLFCEEIDKLIW